jgi:hypothetical protein
LRHTFVPRIRYLGFTTRGKNGPLTTTGDLSACKSKRTLIQLLTINRRRRDRASATLERRERPPPRWRMSAGRVEAQAPEEGGGEGQQCSRGWRRRPPLRWSTSGGTTRISSGGDAESFFLTSAHRCSCPRRPSWNPTEGGGSGSLPSPVAALSDNLRILPISETSPLSPSLRPLLRQIKRHGQPARRHSLLSGQLASSVARLARANP